MQEITAKIKVLLTEYAEKERRTMQCIHRVYLRSDATTEELEAFRKQFEPKIHPR